MYTFGPIPSRRLGRSLGINNIPYKKCSYSCTYCQLGATNQMSTKRSEYYDPKELLKEVSEKIDQINKTGESLDYITLVPDGEPTLDVNLGKLIQQLKTFGIKLAVITNSSLLTHEAVREDLNKVDLVSLKVDSVYRDVWQRINRPHGRLELKSILDAERIFAEQFKGELVTETMLVKGVNDSIESLNKTATFIRKLNPSKAYILTPTRPPADSNVKAPGADILNMAYQIFNNYLFSVEFIISDEGNDFTFISKAEDELLSILAVHPMRKNAVEEFIVKAKSNWSMVEDLILQNRIRIKRYSGTDYYISNFN